MSGFPTKGSKPDREDLRHKGDLPQISTERRALSPKHDEQWFLQNKLRRSQKNTLDPDRLPDELAMMVENQIRNHVQTQRELAYF